MYANAILNEIYLSGQNLSGQNVKGSVLKGANLSYPDLRGADFTNADLSYADLTGAMLDGAILENTNLEGAYLEGTILESLSDSFSSKKISYARMLKVLPTLEENTKIRLSRKIGIELSQVSFVFPELDDFQKRIFKKNVKSRRLGESTKFRDGSELRILKATSLKSQKELYFLVKSEVNYTSGRVDVLKVKRYPNFRSAFSAYVSFVDTEFPKKSR